MNFSLAISRNLAIVLTAFLGACGSTETAALKAGQVWEIADAPSPNARVNIRRIDEFDDGNWVHFSIVGLEPAPDRSGPPLEPETKQQLITGSDGLDLDLAGLVVLFGRNPDTQTISAVIPHLAMHPNTLRASLTRLITTEEFPPDDDYGFEDLYRIWNEFGIKSGGALMVSEGPLSELLGGLTESFEVIENYTFPENDLNRQTQD